MNLTPMILLNATEGTPFHHQTYWQAYHAIRFVILRSLFLFSVLFIFFTSVAQASSIQAVTLPQVFKGSQLVFEGVVVSKRVQVNASGAPFTYFTFRILDVIKGIHSASTIELGYMGGDLGNGEVMQITDMRMPMIGERGIYFVESTVRQQVHPLYGWQQGHYLVKQGKTSLIVTPVYTPPVKRLKKGGSINRALTTPQTLQQFKSQLRSLTGVQ